MSNIDIMATIGLKRERSSYDAAFKLKVVEFAEVTSNWTTWDTDEKLTEQEH